MGNPRSTHSLPKTRAAEESQESKIRQKMQGVVYKRRSTEQNNAKNSREKRTGDRQCHEKNKIPRLYEEVYDGHWPSSAAHPHLGAAPLDVAAPPLHAAAPPHFAASLLDAAAPRLELISAH